MRSCPLMYFLEPDQAAPAHAYDHDHRLTRKEPALGPGERTGALATPCALLCDLQHDPERQTWINAGGLWIGIDRQEKLLPADVARRDQRPGHPVKLGDGQLWEIPVARLATGGSGLPRRRAWGPDGKVVWEVEAAYAELSAFADKVWNLLMGQSVVIMESEIDAMAGQALSVNYRIGYQEAVALGLYTDQALRELMQALIDMPTVKAWTDAQKKTAGT